MVDVSDDRDVAKVRAARHGARDGRDQPFFSSTCILDGLRLHDCLGALFRPPAELRPGRPRLRLGQVSHWSTYAPTRKPPTAEGESGIAAGPLLAEVRPVYATS